MKRVVTFFSLLVFAPALASAATLVIPSQVPFAKDAEVPAAVKEECQLPTKLSDFIRENAKDKFDKVVTDKATDKDAMILTLEIYDLEGRGGGAWSGAKSVGVRGKLTQNGKSLGDFKAKRYSGGGAFAGYKGTCSILGRCVKTLGADIATWAKHPTDGARLGDLR